MPLVRSKKAKPAKGAAKVRRPSMWPAVWSQLRTLTGYLLAALTAAWRWLGPPPTRVLAPYVRPRRIGRLGRTAVTLITLLFCFIYGFGFGLFAPVLIIFFFIPLVILALLVIWALPDVGRGPTGALEGLFLASVLTMLLWPAYLAMSLPGVPRITFLRLIGVPMAICLLVCLSMSAPFRQQLSEALKSSRLLWRTIFLFGLIQMGSIVFSADKGTSINLLINLSLSWYALFFVSCYSFAPAGRAQRFAFVIWGTAVALGLLGLWEYRLGQLPWVGHIPGFLKIDDPLVAKILAGSTRGRGQHRVQGPFTTSLAMAEYLALTMPFLLYFVVGRFRLWTRIAAGATIPLVFAAILFTQARTGLLGTMIAFMVFPLGLGVLYARRHRHSMLAWMALYSSPFLALLGLGIAFTVPGIRVRLLGGGNEQLSTQARKDQWHMGIPKILSHPWGTGLGLGAETLGYRNPDGFLSIDSYPLRMILEYGVIGIAVYYAYAAIALIYVSKNTWEADEDYNHAALFIACGVAVLSFMAMQVNFAQQDNEPVMFIIYGLIVGLQHNRRKAPPAPSPAPDKDLRGKLPRAIVR